ncbi:MAG: hypothetical protein J7642_18025 [Cyanobacteria bacterium SBC]|nr:hypothetical protein [Cyanobacteria bacterium SBC]
MGGLAQWNRVGAGDANRRNTLDRLSFGSLAERTAIAPSLTQNFID